jgi:hypothetical protein
MTPRERMGAAFKPDRHLCEILELMGKAARLPTT